MGLGGGELGRWLDLLSRVRSLRCAWPQQGRSTRVSPLFANLLRQINVTLYAEAGNGGCVWLDLPLNICLPFGALTYINTELEELEGNSLADSINSQLREPQIASPCEEIMFSTVA